MRYMNDMFDSENCNRRLLRDVYGDEEIPINAKIIYVKVYNPNIFGGLVIGLWKGMNHENIILPMMNSIATDIMVTGMAPFACSDMYEKVLDTIGGDDIGCFSSKTYNGDCALVYASSRAMIKAENMDNLTDCMIEQLMKCVDIHNDNPVVLMGNGDPTISVYRKIYGKIYETNKYTKFATVGMFMSDEEYSRFSPELILNMVYKFGYWDWIETEVSSITKVHVLPFPKTYEGQISIIECASKDKSPKEWIDEHWEELIDNGLLNPYWEELRKPNKIIN